MKTVLCGLGKCGCRMALDFHSLIFDGKFSYELHIPRELIKKEREGFWAKLFGKSNNPSYSTLARNIQSDEVPHIHMGDADANNEVINMCRTPSEDEKETENRRKLEEYVIDFSNYHDGCGQYHIIGEQVMRNLLEKDSQSKAAGLTEKVVNAYINRENNRGENVSSYILLFGAGGGTGCGTSTILAQEIAQRAKNEFVNMLLAGVAALPGDQESNNYKISAGRFLTKFLSAERATSFDTIFTISNSIMQEKDEDKDLTFCRANLFVAHFICSLINSSSKYHRSPVNTDGPELRKNIHGLSYFCYGQHEKAIDPDGLIGMELLTRALGPVTTYPVKKDGGFKSWLTRDRGNDTLPPPAEEESAARGDTFQGSSILLSDNKFSAEQWNAILDTLREFRERVREENPEKDIEKLRSLATELFPNPKDDLPLAMRSCQNVVVLRGVPESGKASTWEQTVVTTALERLFPKADIHYYITYHPMELETLTLIPSNYISREILGLICTYLCEVWKPGSNNKKAERVLLAKMLAKDEDISEETIEEFLGDREHFEQKFPDFLEMKERLSGLFKLEENAWEDSFIKAASVASMMGRTQKIAELVQREQDDGIDPLDEIDI